MTPLQRRDAEVRFIAEWAYLVIDGLDSYARNPMSTTKENRE